MSTTRSHDQEHTVIGNNFNTAMREHMFDKVLTPSDVGKLNRLVIPKQHAENYFPLEENQNGTMLDFEDRNGKTWRFRYSYWASSQSYVMTKGWSRFVKDKKLEAADTVSFHRTYVAADEPENQRKIMFIDYRHRTDINLVPNMDLYSVFGSPTYPTASNYYPVPENSMPHNRSFPPLYHNHFQERESLGYGYGGRYYAGSPLVYDSYPVLPAARVTWSAMLPPSPPPPPPSQPPERTAAKKLRLFGVDVEESYSSGETRSCEMGVVGHSPSSPVVIREDEASWWSPRGNMGASSSSLVMQLSDDENYKRKGKSLDLY